MEVSDREKVENSLKQVLADAKFAAAPQMSAFLRFIVNQTLDGNASRIKAYTVAIDALGKPDSFDPQNDPSVRVLAKRLRDTLSSYYERTSGQEVIIELKCGSYVPKFHEGKTRETNQLNSVVAPTAVQAIPTVTQAQNGQAPNNIRSIADRITTASVASCTDMQDIKKKLSRIG